MKKIYYLGWICGLLLISNGLKAQDYQMYNVSLDNRTGLPRYAEFAEITNLTESAFLNWFKGKYQLNPGVEFKLLRSDQDEIGFTHSRYREYFNGIEVLHSILIVHSKNGSVESFNGEYFNKFPNASDNTLSIDVARTIALKSYGSQVTGKWQIPEEEAFLKAIKQDPDATWYPKTGTEYYAYPEYYDGKEPLIHCLSFDISLAQPRLCQQVLVGIEAQKVFRTIALEVHTDSAGKAATYYEGTKNIVADFVTTNSFRLRETGKRKVETYRGAVGTDYTDADNVWNTTADKIAGDVHYGAELVSDFMKKYFNANSYDNNGGALVAVTTGGSGNAFWNLSTNNATFLIGTSGSVGPCASLDVVGHEFGHGIADEITGLIYSGEACAIHESFADINGHNTEFMNDSAKANWWLGEKVWSSSNGIRYMKNPWVFGNPKAYGGQYFPQGCHGSGGVQNYWFYMQVAGDTATNEFSYKYSLKGLGIHKANKILYRSMFYYMIPNSKFSDQYIGTLKAAKDLYGSCSYELEHTYQAWKAVNVEDTSVKTVDLSHGIKAPTLLCNGAPVSATIASFGDVSRLTYWQINNKDTSTKKSLTYNFSNTGSYKIKLTTTTCGKSFVDSMYTTVNYTPKPSFTSPIDSACAGSTNYTFSNKTINADTKIPLKYEWYVNPGAVTDTSKNLKTSFPIATDYEIQLKAYYAGGCWAVVKRLVTILDAPIAQFTVVKDVCENRPVRLRNLTDTVNKQVAFEWTFPDFSVFKGFEPKTQSIKNSGSYDIILKAQYPYGSCSDTAMRKITILPNPKPNFTYKNNCKNLEMTLVGSGVYYAPKQWSQWHLGTFNPLNKDTMVFNALDSASRTIGYTIGDSDGCFATVYKTIVLQTLKASLSSQPVCLGDSSYFVSSENSSESISRSWNFGDGFSTNDAVKSHKYLTAGKYPVTLQLKTTSCETVVKTSAVVNASPAVNFITADVCKGDTVYFSNKTPGSDTANFEWNFGDNQSANAVNTSHIFGNTVTTTYNVNLKGSFKNGCSSNFTKQVTVFELPNCNFNANFDGANNNYSFLPMVSNYSSYSWDFGDGETSNLEKPAHRYKTNGKYTVKLIARNSAGCECLLTSEVVASTNGIGQTAKHGISVYPNPADHFLFVQNPNGSFEYKIFDSKGELVLNGTSLNNHLYLNTEEIKAGFYTLQLNDQAGITTHKLIVE